MSTKGKLLALYILLAVNPFFVFWDPKFLKIRYWVSDPSLFNSWNLECTCKCINFCTLRFLILFPIFFFIQFWGKIHTFWQRLNYVRCTFYVKWIELATFLTYFDSQYITIQLACACSITAQPSTRTTLSLVCMTLMP